MLSKDQSRQIETDATQRAMRLSDDALKAEAVRVYIEHRDSPEGDQRDELELIDRAYVREVVRRWSATT
jgi:hypothetical protein